MRKQKTATKIRRTAFALGFALLLGACGQALADSPAINPETTTTMPLSPPTTTAPDPIDTTTTTRHSAPTTTVPDATPDQGDAEVLVYLFDFDPEVFDCAAVSPVVHRVQPPMVLSGAIEALLAGPTAEDREAGYGSWFSEEVGWKLASATISDGVAHIDFTEDSPFINNASTSCGSMSFLGQLDMTATQFPTVDRAVYSIGGDVRVFYEWLQRDVPEV